ncbi:MAG: purine-nucleoside phosphorylase [Burkholderiales bacterium]|uniref:purine-nucleoside phosphorylase n=1 Tax=Inhella sp. TaxID=1921806 RepID=UPI001ACA1C5D|nr:purine-nucleoside phosphorylase [Burkholderiales bacterium]
MSSPYLQGDALAAAIRDGAATLRQRFGEAPSIAVVLGSGWAGASESLQDAERLPYQSLPGWPLPKVEGHVNELVVGKTAAGARVAMLRGRAHTYESGDCTGMAAPIRTLKAWGVQVLVLTNASGSLRAKQPPGSLMLISDHLNAPQRSPLVGLTGMDRFCDMSAAWDRALRQTVLARAREMGEALHEGIYCWALGPQFETPAEIRMFQAWGADAVGMSTVPDVILARHAGLRVLGLALMTNMGAGLSDEALTHELTLSEAKKNAERAASFLTEALNAIHQTL